MTLFQIFSVLSFTFCIMFERYAEGKFSDTERLRCHHDDVKRAPRIYVCPVLNLFVCFAITGSR